MWLKDVWSAVKGGAVGILFLLTLAMAVPPLPYGVAILALAFVAACALFGIMDGRHRPRR